MPKTKVAHCLLTAIICFLISQPVYAEDLIRAEGETLAMATGHYARARSLLIEALKEFDRAQKIADPSALLDVNLWRDTLLDRSKELERVLDPQPRASNSGVVFGADKRLLNEAKD